MRSGIPCASLCGLSSSLLVLLLPAWACAAASRQLESIRRATQRCRDIGASFLYLPHRVRGKLHVLKVENYGGAKGQGDDETVAAADPTETLHSYGKVLSVEAFMKEDFSRYFMRRLSCTPLHRACGGIAWCPVLFCHSCGVDYREIHELFYECAVFVSLLWSLPCPTPLCSMSFSADC